MPHKPFADFVTQLRCAAHVWPGTGGAELRSTLPIAEQLLEERRSAADLAVVLHERIGAVVAQPDPEPAFALLAAAAELRRVCAS